LNKEKILSITDKIIIVFLLIQIFSVSFSIGLSSISFGIWGGLWIIQIVYTRKIGILGIISKDIKLIALFIFLFLLADFFSLYFAVIPEGAFTGLKRFLLYLVFFAAIVKIKDKDTLNKFLLTILLVFTAISVYEIVLYIMKFPEEAKHTDISLIRLYSFAFFLTTGEMKMLVFITLFPIVFLKEKLFIPKKYLITSLSVIFISMYLTQSRNVFLALIICFLVFGLFINRKFLIYLLIFVTAVLLVIPAQFRERITSIADPTHPSNESRLIMWKVGWQMFKDHPLTGVGDNEITQVYKMYRQPEFHGEGSHLHSNYFMVLATKGIFGIVFFIALFFAFFLKHFKYFRNAREKTDRYLIFGCILAMISFHISGIFEWNYGDWEVLTLLLFIISIPFVLYNLNNKQETQTEI
jgi:O-antigen ligase